MFSVEQRDRVHDRLVEMAREDPRVVAAAVVGSRAGGDRWSDLDLTFGLAAAAGVAEAVERAAMPPSSAEYILGLGVHHAVRARFCIERGRPWQAEYWISAARDQALALACLRHGLEAVHARGCDRLPGEVAAAFEDALVRSLDRAELLRALGCAIQVLLRESAEVSDLGAKVERPLRELLRP